MKRTVFFTVCVFLISLFSVNSVLAGVFPVSSAESSFAAGCAIVPTHSMAKADFCSGFNTDAICACKAEDQSPTICNAGAKTIYSRLIQPLGISLACRLHTPQGMSYQECVDQWNCYMFGTAGKPSDGECFGQTSASGC